MNSLTISLPARLAGRYTKSLRITIAKETLKKLAEFLTAGLIFLSFIVWLFV